MILFNIVFFYYINETIMSKMKINFRCLFNIVQENSINIDIIYRYYCSKDYYFDIFCSKAELQRSQCYNL